MYTSNISCIPSDNTNGMVAVVRGLQDAGLAVTLFDNGKEFTLAPNTYGPVQPIQGQNSMSVAPLASMAHSHGHNLPQVANVVHGMSPPIHYVPNSNQMGGVPIMRSTATDMPKSYSNHTAAQAVDGRYASVYQATIGKMQPTSPPVHTTEFPPQRPIVEPGGSHFVVGGAGSGDTRYYPVRIPNNYRGGGRNFPDKESVFSPRPSVEIDAFAKSLRKYPRLSPERSTEIVERLVNYSQAKNYYGRSPNRDHCERELETPESRRSRSPAKITRGCEAPQLRIYDESPTRDRPKRGDEPIEVKKVQYFNSYDVRHLRDISKAIRENINSTPTPNHTPCDNQYQYNHQSSCYYQRDRSPSTRKSSPEQQSTPNMVHSEIQAAVKMVCREVETVPRIQPPQRNVKVPCSDAEQGPNSEGQVFSLNHTQVQTTRSTIQLTGTLALNSRKSRSHEEFCKTFKNKDEFLATLKKPTFKEETNNTKDLVKHNTDDQNERVMQIRKRRRTHRNRIYCTKCIGTKHYDVFRAEVSVANKDYVLKTVKSWLSDIALKNEDYLGRSVKKEQIICYIVRRIRMIPMRVQIDKKKFRAEILDIIDDIPIDTGRGSKNIYMKKIAEDLIAKLEFARITNAPFDRYQSRRCFSSKYVVNTAADFNKFIRPSYDEIKNFVKGELIEAIHKSHLDIKCRKAREIESELVDLLSENLEDVERGREKDVVEEIISIVEDIGQISKFQALYFTRMLLKNFKNRFLNRGTDENIKNIMHAYQYNTGITDESINTLITTSVSTRNHSTSQTIIKSMNKYCETCEMGPSEMPAISVKSSQSVPKNSKFKGDLDVYTQELFKNVEEWLNTLAGEIPQIHRREFRSAVVKELVDDIVDRQKYLKLNPTSYICERDELEHLRYQIFKWIYRLVGENKMVILQRAPSLMKIIKRVSVPESFNVKRRKSWKRKESIVIMPLTNEVKKNRSVSVTPQLLTVAANQTPEGFVATCHSSNQEELPKVNASLIQPKGSKGDDQQSPRSVIVAVTTLNPATYSSGSGNPSGAPLPTPTIHDLNLEFLQFVTDWVNSLPIPPNTPEENEIRIGFLQGLVQALAKIKSSPVIVANPLYYEDALDDELENLFSLLPQTDELLARKHVLKVEMIQKNCQMNEMIKQMVMPSTFGQQVRDQIEVYIPRTETKTHGEDMAKIFEEVKILHVIDEYILFLGLKDEDEMKANVHKTKLLRHLQEFVHNLKQTHSAELMDLDEAAYIGDIITAMERVPLPSDDTIKQEADEVMLGMEIDKWFSDLPLAANDSVLEQYKRRRLKDKLSKKVYEMEKNMSSADESGEMALRHEVSQILEKLPFEKNESLNINFMVDELTNRIKNRQKISSGRRKSVGFHDSAACNQLSCGASSSNMNAHHSGAPQIQRPNIQQPGTSSERWINVPGTPMAVDKGQTIIDSAGRLWFTLDPTSMSQSKDRQIFPGNQRELSLSGAANAMSAGTQFHPQMIPQPETSASALPRLVQSPAQPFMPAPAPSCAPVQGIVAPATGNTSPGVNQQQPSAEDFWLSKALRDYEATHPPSAMLNTSLQFGPARSATIQDPSLFMANQQKPVSSSMNLSKDVQSSHQQLPPSPLVNQSLGAQLLQQSQPGHQESPKLETSKQGCSPRNVCKPKSDCQKIENGWPYSLTSHETTQKGPISGSGRKEASTNKHHLSQKAPNQTSSSRQSSSVQTSTGLHSSDFLSMAQSQAPLQNVQPTPAPIGTAQPMPNPCGIGCAVQAASQDLSRNQEAPTSMWLSKYLENYEAAHPQIGTLNNSVQQAPQDVSLRLPPQNVSVLAPPEYEAFGQERPVSSSFQNQQLGQTLDGPAFERSVAAQQQSLAPSSSLHTAQPNMMVPQPVVGPQNMNVSQPIPQASPCAGQPNQAGVQPVIIQVPVESQASSQGPMTVQTQPSQTPGFFKSTDRDGIQTFIDKNKNTSNIATETDKSTSCCGLIVKTGQQGVQVSGIQSAVAIQQTSGRFPTPSLSQVKGGPLSVQGNVSHQAGAAGAVLLGAGGAGMGGTGTGAAQKNPKIEDDRRRAYEDTDDDLDAKCKCLARIKKMRKMGVCRKCNNEYPMRFFPPVCPWYF